MKDRWIKLLSILLVVSLTGCSSFGRKMKAFLGGGKASSKQAAKRSKSKVSYAQDANVYNGIRRQYKRVTRKTLRDQSDLNENAGSLWVMEGQGSYLFSQNIMRMIGDPLAVILDGEPRDQIKIKVGVIRKLISQYEDRLKRRRRQLAKVDKSKRDPAAKAKGAEQNNKGSADKSALSEDLPIRTVPTRVLERTVDGNYRVKGSQPFMLGSREYKVIVTGIVRAEDFNDEGVGATKLMDSKFDVVSARKRE